MRTSVSRNGTVWISFIVLIMGTPFEALAQTFVDLNRFSIVVVEPVNSDKEIGGRTVLMKKLQDLFKKKKISAITPEIAAALPTEKAVTVLYCSIASRQTAKFHMEADLVLYDFLGQVVYAKTGKGWGYGSPAEILMDALEDAFDDFDSRYDRFDQGAVEDALVGLRSRMESLRGEKDESHIMDYLKSHQGSLNPIEGVWTAVEDNRYRIGIVKSDKPERDFEAVILTSTNPFWRPMQTKIEFWKTAIPTAFTVTYYLADHSKLPTTGMLSDLGLFEVSIKNPDGTQGKAAFIKNFPPAGQTQPQGSSDASSSGSGFLVAETGIVVTNWHVVNAGTSIEVVFPKISKTFTAKLLIKDRFNDLALVKLDNFVFANNFVEPIPFVLSSSDRAQTGAEVYTIGFPLGGLLGSEGKVATGTINSQYGLRDDPRHFQISNPIQPGNSGGPLFTTKGEIVGIVVASLNAKYLYENADIIPQNVNFAVKSDYLLNLVGMLPDAQNVKLRQNRLSYLTREKQVEAIAPYVANIIVK